VCKQELKGNIRVFCRCRKDDRIEKPAPTVISDNEILVHVGAEKKPKLYEFDRVYGCESKQEEVYEDASAIITSCIDGYNVAFLGLAGRFFLRIVYFAAFLSMPPAYGQTGSGKTFTMMGTPENPGVNRRAVQELFNICHEREDYNFVMGISLMEVYNDNVYDLLVDQRDREGLKVMTNEDGRGTYVLNLSKRTVNAMEDVYKVYMALCFEYNLLI
jgi:kinesin family protein C2/C3